MVGEVDIARFSAMLWQQYWLYSFHYNVSSTSRQRISQRLNSLLSSEYISNMRDGCESFARCASCAAHFYGPRIIDIQVNPKP